MERYATFVDDGSVYVETDDGPLEIGSVDAIRELVGGDSYDIVYEEEYARTVDWLDLDEQDTMTIDVMDTIADMDYPEPFVGKLRERTLSDGGEPSERTTYFVEVMTEIWDNKGNLDHMEEHPFR